MSVCASASKSAGDAWLRKAASPNGAAASKSTGVAWTATSDLSSASKSKSTGDEWPAAKELASKGPCCGSVGLEN
eukprot:1516230-Karenia_brevis.AAC.1